MENTNVFAGAYVDRYGEGRKDPEWLDGAMRDPGACFVPVWGEKCIVGGDPLRAIMFRRERLGGLAVEFDDFVFLGLFRGRPAFAFGIEDDGDPPFRELGEFHDLRYLGSILPPDEANLVAHARALILWHRSQTFCGRCGSSTRPATGGNTRRCVKPECGARAFSACRSRHHRPGDQKASVACWADSPAGPKAATRRSPASSNPAKAWRTQSAAKFTRRRTYDVDAIGYHSSQPWPFPASLMLGFVAAAASTDISLNDGELEDARWFTRKELLSGYPKLPFAFPYLRRLIDDWLAAGKAEV